MCRELLEPMVKKGWATEHTSMESFRREAGAASVAHTRLTLITKVKPDGSLKHRLIWDMRRSGVNGLIQQAERIVLPRSYDFVEDILALGRETICSP